MILKGRDFQGKNQQEDQRMKALRMCLFLLFLAVPLTVQGAEKAKTVDELAKMYDVSACKKCHKEIFEEWEKSIHARSLIGTGRTMATIKTAITDGMMKDWAKSGIKEVKDIKVEHMLHCLKCHLPQLKDATDAVAQQIAKAAIDGDDATLAKVNINCIICHNRKALVHKLVDGEPEHQGIDPLRPVPRPGAQFRPGEPHPVRDPVRELSAQLRGERGSRAGDLPGMPHAQAQVGPHHALLPRPRNGEKRR